MLYKLRGLMAERSVSCTQLASLINRQRNYVSIKIKQPWLFSMHEVYVICNYLEIPYEEIPRYFPPEPPKTVMKCQKSRA